MLTKKIKRRWVRHWLPQGLRNFLNQIFGFSIIYRGKFHTWAEARERATGYDDTALFERIVAAANSVKSGAAAWEKDGITFDRVPENFRLWACLCRAALGNQGRLTVMDFGGAFGSSYYQCKDFLADIDLRWCVVEQGHVAEYGAKVFSNESLNFYSSLESCLKQERPNFVLLSSVLQYLESPYVLLAEIVKADIEYLLIDRHPCSSGSEIITVQVLPSKVFYPGSYPCRLFNCQEMMGWLSKYYDLLVEYDNDDVDPPIRGRGFWSDSRGYFLRRRIISLSERSAAP